MELGFQVGGPYKKKKGNDKENVERERERDCMACVMSKQDKHVHLFWLSLDEPLKYELKRERSLEAILLVEEMLLLLSFYTPKRVSIFVELIAPHFSNPFQYWSMSHTPLYIIIIIIVLQKQLLCIQNFNSQ